MKKEKGNPLPLGVMATDTKVNFSVAVSEGNTCELLLYKSGTQTPCEVIPMTECVGEVHFLALSQISIKDYEYNYRMNGCVMIDPYVKAIAGREQWKREYNVEAHEVRGILASEIYDWEGDSPLNIPYYQVVAYSLHIRGFTKHTSSGVPYKGTFQGVIEKIPYLQDLGINQIQCMPVYEFQECKRYVNYWGYGDAFYFAPKSAYASSGDGATELKCMVKACHKAGIEVVLEMPFTAYTSKQMIEECLRYYMLEYHIDGFILNPSVAPMEGIYADPILKKTKIMKHQQGFQMTMRRFLKGDEGMVNDVIAWLSSNSEQEGSFNYIANHNGFTLNDLVSYDGKHNEMNGENNQDGTEYNYSWNCGAEGPSRRKDVMALRKKQMTNAFFLLLLSQGVPCILAGDEFANTQKGNNNVYCQDNPIGWVNWERYEKEQELRSFVKALIEVRKANVILCQTKKLKGADQTRCGVPDVSYHGESAWKVPTEVSSRQLGVYYHKASAETTDCFIAYNMHWLAHSFALPVLPKGKQWYKVAATKEGVLKKAELIKNQRIVELNERTVYLLMGR